MIHSQHIRSFCFTLPEYLTILFSLIFLFLFIPVSLNFCFSLFLFLFFLFFFFLFFFFLFPLPDSQQPGHDGTHFKASSR